MILPTPDELNRRSFDSRKHPATDALLEAARNDKKVVELRIQMTREEVWALEDQGFRVRNLYDANSPFGGMYEIRWS